MTKYWTVFVTASLATLFAIFIAAPSARADIFQWEYINPANPGLGKQQSTTLAPDGAGANAVRGATLSNRNLTKAYLIGADLSPYYEIDDVGHLYPYVPSDLSNANLSQADLSNANLDGANLVNANLAGANVQGAEFATVFYYFLRGGLTAGQLYSTVSYQARDLNGITLSGNSLAGVNLAGQDLTNANFNSNGNITYLNGADLSQANLAHATFAGAHLTNANFRQANLANANLVEANLTGANLSQANLTNANFSGYNDEYFLYYTDLTGANLSGADARGADFYLATLTGANTSNLIQSNGHIAGLDLMAGVSLVVRDYDGNSAAYPTATGPQPIVVEQQLVTDATSALQLVFDADPWDSLISFAPGIPVTLGGTLDLTFAPGVDVATQSGRTIDLFDWTGVEPTGAFTVSSPYVWNLSNLYTTGEVTLAAVPGFPGDFNNNGVVDAADYVVWRNNDGTQTSYDTWRANFGTVFPGIGAGSGAADLGELSRAVPSAEPLSAAVPEPASAVLLATVAAVFSFVTARRRQTRSAQRN